MKIVEFLVYLLFSGVVVANIFPPNNIAHRFTEKDKRQPVLILDIDGTLYDDDCKIETQIAEGCFTFANQFGYNIEESNKLHHRYGSTICGICVDGNQPRSTYRDYCNDVYPRLDISKLRKYSASVGDTLSTGYSEDTASALRSLCKLKCPIVIASNSPTFHVKRVLSRLGLSQLPIQYIITPERRGGLTKAEPQFWEIFNQLYPPSKFACTLIDDNALNIKIVRSLGIQGWHINKRFSLTDSILHFLSILPSSTDLLVSETVSGSFQDPNWLNFNAFRFDSAQYLRNKNLVDQQSFNPLVRAALVDQLVLTFDTPQTSAASTHSTPITRLVVDIGAGLLHMLPQVADMMTSAYQQSVSGASTSTSSLKLVYIAFESNAELNSDIEQSMKSYGLKVVPPFSTTIGDEQEYINSSIDFEGSHIINGIQTQFFVHVYNADAMSDDALRIIEATRKKYTTTLSNDDDKPVRKEVDLIVGSCVVDLIPPRRLVSQLVEMANDHPALLYLPITFVGKTSLHRVRSSVSTATATAPTTADHDFSSSNSDVQDEKVFDMYLKHLHDRGHHTDASSLLHELLCYGCHIIPPSSHFIHSSPHSSSQEPVTTHVGFGQVDKYLQQSTSSWNISPYHHPYMWQSMIRFLALGVVFRSLHIAPFRDLTGWFQRLQREAVEECNVLSHQHSRLSHGHDSNQISRSIMSDEEDDVDRLLLVASNIDILARLPRVQQFIHTDRTSTINTQSSNTNTEFGAYFGTYTLDELKLSPPFQTSKDTNIDQFNRIIRRELSMIRDFSSEKVSFNLPPFATTNITTSPAAPVSGDTVINVPTANPATTSDSAAATHDSADVSHTCSVSDVKVDSLLSQRLMVEFVAPGSVCMVADTLPTVGPEQILLRSVCSLVSTGTELKVFNGELDSTQPADTTIKGLADQSLGYPLQYGYSLVGEVVDSKDSRANGLKPGDRVFSFSAHGSHHALDSTSVMRVPDGVSSADATFLPSVETAVSLVMKAAPILGECVGVVGAGLIGILAAQVLQKTGVEIVLIDVRDDRLSLAASAIPDLTLYNPLTRTVTKMKNSIKVHSYVYDESSTDTGDKLGLEQSLDTVIEVSGTAGGLNTAISLTRDSGRIVLGSWYGDRPLPITLGTRFHRSHIQLVSSQVSSVPAELTGRWSKSRRFELAWDTLRQLQPASLFLSPSASSSSIKTASVHQLRLGSGDSSSKEGGHKVIGDVDISTILSENSAVVQSVYEALKKGLQLTALFEYK